MTPHAKQTRQAIDHYLEALAARRDSHQRQHFYEAKTAALNARRLAQTTAEREIAQAIINAVDTHQPIDSLKETNNPT